MIFCLPSRNRSKMRPQLCALLLSVTAQPLCSLGFVAHQCGSFSPSLPLTSSCCCCFCFQSKPLPARDLSSRTTRSVVPGPCCAGSSPGPRRRQRGTAVATRWLGSSSSTDVSMGAVATTASDSNRHDRARNRLIISNSRRRATSNPPASSPGERGKRRRLPPRCTSTTTTTTVAASTGRSASATGLSGVSRAGGITDPTAIAHEFLRSFLGMTDEVRYVMLH